MTLRTSRVYVLTLLGYLLATQSSAFQSTIITQDSLGAIAKDLPPVYFKTAEWSAVYELKYPCIDDLHDTSIKDTIMTMVTGLSNAVTAYNESLTSISNTTYSYHDHLFKAIISGASEVSKRSVSLISLYDSIKMESETLYGIMPNSVCDESIPSELKLSTTKTPNTLSDKDINVPTSKVELLKKRTKRSPKVDPDDSTIQLTLDKKNCHGNTFYKNNIQTINQYFTILDNVSNSTQNAKSKGKNVENYASISTTLPSFGKLDYTNSPKLKPDTTYRALNDLDTIERESRNNDRDLYQQYTDALTKFKQLDNYSKSRMTREATSFFNMAADIQSCFETCGQFQQQLIKAFAMNKHTVPQPSISREKRSVLPFLGRVSRYLYGTATEEQVMVLDKKITNLNIQMEKTTGRMISLGKDFASMIQVLQESSNKKILESLDKVDVLDKQLNGVVSGMKNIMSKLDESQKLSLVLSSSSTLTSITMRTLAIYQEMEYQLLNIQKFYISIRDAMAANTFPYQLIPSSELRNILQDIKKSLPPHMSIVPHSNLQQLFTNIPVSGVHNGTSIYICVDVPLVMDDAGMRLWEIHTIPVLTDANWVQTQVSHNYIIKYVTKNIWTTLFASDFTQCVAHPLRICSVMPEWKSQEMTICETALIGIGGSSAKLCIIAPVKIIFKEDIHYIRISSNEWLISTNSNATLCSINCYDQKEKKSHIVTKQIGTYSRLVLKPGCTADIAGHMLIPEAYKIGGYHTQIMMKTLDSQNNYAVTDISYEIPKIQLRSARSTDILLGKSDQKIFSRGATLDDLARNNNNMNKMYASDIELLRDEFTKIPNVSYTSDWWSGFLSSWWQKVLLGLGMIAGILVLCKIIPILCKTSPAALTAIPLTRNIPGSYAMPPEPDMSTTSTTPIPILSNLTLDEVLKNLTLQHSKIGTIITRNMHYHILTMVVVMIIIAIICHIITSRHLHYLHSRTRLKLGYRAINRAVTHMPGEVKLMLGFLVKISSPLSKHPIYHEIICQVCTLPGRREAWSCKVTPGRDTTMQRNVNHRWLSYYTFRIVWGGLCLKSVQFPNMDTCRDLPSIITLRKDEVLSNRQAKLPFMWTSVSAHSVTKVYLEDETGSNTVFSFDMYPDMSSIV